MNTDNIFRERWRRRVEEEHRLLKRIEEEYNQRVQIVTGAIIIVAVITCVFIWMCA